MKPESKNVTQSRPTVLAYRPDVDGLRAIAVVAVIIYHLNKSWLPGGFCGVDVFFVISGFVVTRSVLGQTFDGAFPVWFYARRVRRILPALLVCTLVTSALPCVFMPPGEAHKALVTGLSSLLGLSNVRLLRVSSDYNGIDAEIDPYTHTWSLGVEEQFYLTFPALLVLLFRPARAGAVRTEARSWVWQSVFGATLLASVVASVVFQFRSNVGAAFYLMPARFWELGIGVVLATRDARGSSKQHPERCPKPVRNMAWPGAVLALAMGGIGFAMPFRDILFPVPLAVPSAFAAASAVGIGSTYPNSMLPRLLSNAVLVRIGKMSYSLYLWHWPVLVALRWTIGATGVWACGLAVVMTGLLSAASYYLVEGPGRRWRTSGTRTIAAGVTGIGIVAVTMLLFLRPLEGALYLGRKDTRGEWSEIGRPIPLGDGIWRPELCSLESATDAGKVIRSSECTFRSRGSTESPSGDRRRVLLLGNSFAEAAIPMLRALLDSGGRVEVVAVAAWGCYPGTSMSGVDWKPSCDYYARQIVPDLLTDLRSGDIVLLFYDTSFLTDEGPNPNGDIREREATDRSVLHEGRPTSPLLRRQLLKQELIDLAAAIRDRSATLVFQATTPLTRGTNPRRCQGEWFRPDKVARGLCPTYARERHLAIRQPVMETLADVKRVAPNFLVFDPFDAMCPGHVCEWFEEGRPIWRDSNHISVWKAEAIGLELRKLLQSEGLL